MKEAEEIKEIESIEGKKYSLMPITH